MLTVTNPKSIVWGDMPLAEMAKGNALDSYFTYKSYEVLNDKLSQLEMIKVYESLMAPAITFFTEVELDGLIISEDQLKVLGKQLKDKIIDTEDALYSFSEVKKDMNMGSTQDLIRVFYSLIKSEKDWIEDTENYGFHLYPPIFTDKGQPSTSFEALDLLLTQIKDEIARRESNGKKNARRTK
jgi:DNA polymerase I-like protein with 3'-5' exonuclease and polymerase domains